MCYIYYTVCIPFQEKLALAFFSPSFSVKTQGSAQAVATVSFFFFSPLYVSLTFAAWQWLVIPFFFFFFFFHSDVAAAMLHCLHLLLAFLKRFYALLFIFLRVIYTTCLVLQPKPSSPFRSTFHLDFLLLGPFFNSFFFFSNLHVYIMHLHLTLRLSAATAFAAIPTMVGVPGKFLHLFILLSISPFFLLTFSSLWQSIITVVLYYIMLLYSS